jgi:hypothetical protein
MVTGDRARLPVRFEALPTCIAAADDLASHPTGTTIPVVAWTNIARPDEHRL